MITRIELKNFQSHKNTVIDFDKGVNVLTGESDNGKTAVIRAIKWVAENRPLGTDITNSDWNKDFKEDMSVKLFFDNGVWVERVRNKKLNGYRYFTDDKETTLETVSKDVPAVITELLRFSDVNFQYQMDAPYLLSMTSGDASKYLNKIIHLDIIDDMLSTAESDRRNLNAEKKVVEKDITDYKNKIEKLMWLDEANALQKRIDCYNNIIESNNGKIELLEQAVEKYESCKVVDLSEQKKLIKEIEDIKLTDIAGLEKSVMQYSECQKGVVDLMRHKRYVKEIESIEFVDVSGLEKSINDYESNVGMRNRTLQTIEDLKKKLPKVCPLCGHSLEED